MAEIEQQQMAQPYTTPSVVWPKTSPHAIGTTDLNPWGEERLQPSEMWQSAPAPVVTPTVDYDTIKRYAEAGVPFPLDKEDAWHSFRKFIDTRVTARTLQEKDYSELSVHMTRESVFRSVAGEFGVHATDSSNDSLVCTYKDIPIYVVDDETQQGIFAPLEPFYRFAFV